MSDPVQDYLNTYKVQTETGEEVGSQDFVQQYLQKYRTPSIEAGIEDGEEYNPDFEVPATEEGAPPAQPLPPSIPGQTSLTDLITGPRPEAEAPPERDSVAEMRALLQRGDLTASQRARIERLIRAQVKGKAMEQEQADNLLQQLALTTAQSALALPTGIASTLSNVPGVGGLFQPAAQFGQEVIEGLEPTLDPNASPTAQGLIGAAGEVAGFVGAGGPLWRGTAAATRGLLGAGRAVAPAAGARAAAQLEAIATRIGTKTGSAQLANAVRAAPVELLGGTIFQGLTDPESLETPNGIALAVAFGTLGALGEGVRMVKLAERQKRVAATQQAQTLVDKAKASAEEKMAAEIAAKQAEKQAEKTARAAAKRAWNAGTPEMRRALMPDFDDASLATGWKDLSLEQRAKITTKLRAVASDSKLNKPAEVDPAKPEPTQNPIRNAAVQLTDGSVFEGRTHADALEAAEKAKGGPVTLKDTEGYVDQQGNYLSQEQAKALVKVKPTGEGGTLRTEDVFPDRARKPATAETPPSPTTPAEPTPPAPTPAPVAAGSPEGAPTAAAAPVPTPPPAKGGKAKKGKAPAAAAPATPVTPEAPSADAVITQAEQKVKELEAKLQAQERRANDAERRANTDALTGLPNQDAWIQAQKRVDADPNLRVTIFDIKQLHPYNKVYGQKVGDEFIRSIAEKIRANLGEHDQAFRIGGDEFAVVTSAADAQAIQAKILAAVGDHPIKGTQFVAGVRAGMGPNYAEASRVLSEVAAAETGPKARPVETTSPENVVPPAETVQQVTVDQPKRGRGRPKKEEPKERTIDTIDDEIDALEKQLDSGAITQEQFQFRVEKLGAEKRALKKKAATNAAAAQAAKAVGPAAPPPPEVVTRRRVDEAATRNMSLEDLRKEQTNINLRLQQEAGPDARSELLHDRHIVQKEIRMRKPVTELSDQSLDAHANELHSRWMQTAEAERAPLEARLRELDLEFKRRQRPNVVDAFKSERGSLYVNPDPLETQAGNLPAHSQRIQDRIEIDLEGDKPFPSLNEIFEKMHRAYSHVLRGTHAADRATKQLGRDKAPTVKNPGEWAELVAGSLGRAQRMLAFGPFRWDNVGNTIQTGARGMRQILEPFKGRLNEIRRFELARYTMELMQRDKRTGIELLDAVREVNSAAPDVVKAANELVQFRRGVLDYLTDAGMFSTEARAALEKMTQAYVPLYRYFDGKGVSQAIATVGAKTSKIKTLAGPASQVKRLVGSVQKIVDPLRSTVDQARRFVVAADKNRLSLMLVEAAEQNPELAKGLIWKDPRVRSSLDQSVLKQAELLKKGAKQHGIELSNAIAEELAAGLNERRLRTRNDQLQVWRNGKREVWQISPELAQMYQSFQPHELHLAIRMLGFLPQMLKTGITDNPVFGLFNAFKDTFDAAAQSKYGFRWGVDSFNGFLESVRNTKYRQEFLAGAGTAGGITGRAVSTPRTALEAILPKTPAERVTSLVLHPINALRELSIPFEEAARLGEFVRARQAGAPIMDAAIASQRVTTNFRQHGLSMQGINHMAVFLNPAMQSLDTNIRNLTNPKSASRVLAVGTAAITLPSIYLWFANQHDKDIQELRRSKYGNAFWYYRNNGQIYRIPKPFFFGYLFGTLAEDALDAMMLKDPTALDRAGEQLVHQIPYNPIPTALNFTLGLIYNKDFTTGAPIAPDRLESGDGQVSPRYQARPETGPTARAIGDAINVSPAKIEFAVRNALGTLGQDALRAIDMLNDAKDLYPAPVVSDIPVIGRLLGRYPSAGAHSLRRFYDEAREHEVVHNDIALLEKTGKTEELRQYIMSHKLEIGLAETYAETRKTLADMRAATESIANLPPEAMSPERKRQLINTIVDRMIFVARETNETLDKVRERYSNLNQSPQPQTDVLRRAAGY